MNRFTRLWLSTLSTVALVVVSGAVAQSASAITSDYCGRGVISGQSCNEGSGYRGWRYNQVSTGGRSLPQICVYNVTAAGNYRVGSGCYGGSGGFVSIQWCDSEPTTRAIVAWQGSDGTPVLYGHADSRLCGALRASSSTLPTYIADRFRDPESAGQAGVDPATANAVGLFGDVAVFTLQGKTQQCILRDDATGFSAACTTQDQLIRDHGRQLFTESRDDGGYRVYGTTGDATTATMTTKSGAKRSVPVSGSGAFAITTKEKPASITFSGGQNPSQLEAVTAP